MRFPKRFALSTLLLLMFAVAVVFGFLKWRQQRFAAEIAGLGVNRIESYDGGFWATHPRQAVILFHRHGNRLSYDGKTYSIKEIEQRFQPVDEKLESMGVEKVGYLVLAEKPEPNGEFNVEQSFTDLDELIYWYSK